MCDSLCVCIVFVYMCVRMVVHMTVYVSQCLCVNAGLAYWGGLFPYDPRNGTYTVSGNVFTLCVQ